MENLQNEVQRILEKCAKYKVGQTVLMVDSDKAKKCSYETVAITGRILDYDACCEKYGIWYEVKDSGGHEWSEEEDDLFASLDELKEAMTNKHLRIAEMWKNPIDADKEEES